MASTTATYDEIFVDLSTSEVVGHASSPTGKAPPNAFQWKVTIDGPAVEVADFKGTFARATWDGKALANNEVRADRQKDINDYQWGVVAGAVAGFMVNRQAVATVEPLAPITPITPGSAPQPPSAQGTRDLRSGWWAFAAAAIALVAAIVSWKATDPGDRVQLATTIALGVIALGLSIYGGYGLGTRCPSCHAWYRRKTINTTETGSSTYTKQISKPVTDSSGKQIGTTYETGTYERTTYRYDYRCRECSHNWSGTGSSERRIS